MLRKLMSYLYKSKVLTAIISAVIAALFVRMGWAMIVLSVAAVAYITGFVIGFCGFGTKLRTYSVQMLTHSSRTVLCLPKLD